MPGAEDPSYFEENYADYERQTSPAKLRFYMSMLRRWVPPGGRVFELGAGLGHFLGEAAKEYDCRGCDVNAYGVAAARARTREDAVFEGSFETLASQPRQAAVVSWDVLEHIADMDGALSAVHAALEAEGVLIAAVPVYDGPLGWLVRRLDRDRTHVWKLSRRDWIARLERHGFEVVEWGGIVRRLVFRRIYIHLVRPQWLLRRVGSAIYVVARKKT
jgi:SAM-dependent methyltransferase